MSIKAVLKGLHSPDVFDLGSYVPEYSDNFSLLVQAMFGPEGTIGEESFDILICTPNWLNSELDLKSIIIGRHYLIVREYSFDNISKFLSDYADRCQGETWSEVAAKLARLGKWEFEDYSSASES